MQFFLIFKKGFNKKKKEPENVIEEIKEEKLTYTLSVRCDTISENMSDFPEEKRFLVPSDGAIYYNLYIPVL